MLFTTVTHLAEGLSLGTRLTLRAEVPKFLSGYTGTRILITEQEVILFLEALLRS
jgi:hypothetical protein